MTLKHYCREHNSNNGPESPNQQRQFIEISTEQKQSVPLTIGLDLPTINEPTILKTIIMIRNYKRLILGRHEFGPMLYCKSDRA